MVTINKEGDNFLFEVKGMHKLWAVKSQISIPADHIVKVHQDYDTIKGWRGVRMPGTYIPFVLTAGTFYKDGEKVFWDVLNMDHCIIVELKDADYKQLIIEVEDTAEAIKILTA